jgi:hypothetical protein
VSLGNLEPSALSKMALIISTFNIMALAIGIIIADTDFRYAECRFHCNTEFCYAVLLLYYCTTVLLYYCTPVLLYSCTPVLLYPCTPVLLYSCTPVLLYSCTPVLLYSCTPVLLYSCTPVLLHCCTAALLHCCTAVLLYSCTPVLLYYCTFVLLYCLFLYYCSTALLMLLVGQPSAISVDGISCSLCIILLANALAFLNDQEKHFGFIFYFPSRARSIKQFTAVINSLP